MRSLALALAFLIPATIAHADDSPKQGKADKVDEDPEPKLSLPSEADRLAWQRQGFRLALGAVYGQFSGVNGAPGGRLLGATIRAGLRLDETWSLLASLQYASVSRTGGLSGLRFAGTVDPTYHATPNLAIAFGFGFGGIVEGSTGRTDATPLPGQLNTTYTFPDASHPIASCSGVGAAGLVRGEWSTVLGPRASTAIALEIDAQWTACTDDSGRVEPDTGTAILRRQYWAHTGVTLGWTVMWR